MNKIKYGLTWCKHAIEWVFTGYTPGNWRTGVFLGLRWALMLTPIVYFGFLKDSFSSKTADGSLPKKESLSAAKQKQQPPPVQVPNNTVTLSDTAIEKLRIKAFKDSLASVDRLIELRKEANALALALKCKLEHVPAIDVGTAPCTHEQQLSPKKSFVKQTRRTEGVSKSRPLDPTERIYQ